MARSPRKRNPSAASVLTYDRFEPRAMLTIMVDVGDLNSGVAVSDDATGEGYILFSQTDVHDRFSEIAADNADHFVATRLDGLQWQYNNDSAWIDFEPADGDALVSKVNFSGDSVINHEARFVVEGIWWHQSGTDSQNDFIVVPNQFGGEFDKGEFTILADTIGIVETAPPTVFPSETQLSQIVLSMYNYQQAGNELPGLANFDADGNPLLSWRVHILPHMGLESLYEQFNLDEPWNSPHNLPLADQMPSAFKSVNFDSNSRTTFLGIAGDNASFKLDGTPVDSSNVSGFDGLIVETNDSHSVVWTSPVDWYYNPANPLSGLGNASDEGFAIASISAEALTLPSDVDQDAFANLIDVSDDSILDYEALGIEPLETDAALRHLAIAALNYESAFQRLPHQLRDGDGVPLLSWRVAILPFLGHNDLYQQFNLEEPWDSEHNLALLPQIPIEFMHPSVGDNKTVYLGLDGDGTVFDSQLDRGLSFGNITDGTSNTMLFVEADATEAVEWTRPADLSYDATDPNRGLGNQYDESDDLRFRTVMVDGTTNGILMDDPATVAHWASYAGGEINDYDVLEFRTWETDFGISNNMRQIMLGALNHESATMAFPRSIYDTPRGEGSPLLSWRVRILPFIEQNNLYDRFRFDEPWDSPHNLSLLPLMPDIFRTPGVENGMTVFQGPHGDNTFLANENRGRSFHNFSDYNNTTSILQVAPEHAIEWTKPGDFEYDPATIASLVDNASENGFHLSLIDGTVAYFNDTISAEVLNKIVSPADYPDVDLNPMLFRTHNPNSSLELRQAALSALNYESAQMRFPHHATYTERRGGTSLLSWRVEVLPFLGYESLYHRFNHDEPWDSEHNLSLIPLMPHIFSHPGVEHGKSALQAISSNWDPDGPLESMFPLTNELDIGFGRLTDGSSNTIMFVETDAELAVEWTKPQDLVYDSADPAAGLSGRDGQGTWVTFADGSTHFLPSSLRLEQLAAAVSPSSGSLPDLHSDSSYRYGTIAPNLFNGTENNDTVVINVKQDSFDLIVNGESQSFPLSQFDPLIFDALGGVDDLMITAPSGVEITLSGGVIYVGDFAIVAEGFETLGFGRDATLMVDGTDGDDVVVVTYDEESLVATLNGQPLQVPKLQADVKVSVDTGLGNDRLQIFLNRDQNQTSVEGNSLTSFGRYEAEWHSVEFVDIENEQDFPSNFIFFMDPASDAYSVDSDQVVVTGSETTISLARKPDDVTGVGNRTNAPMPIEVTGTTGDDTFDFGYTSNDLNLFKFHHLVYFVDSPVFFDGGDGIDTFRINQLEGYTQPITEATLRPDSIEVGEDQLISWTNIENQVANDVAQVEMYDSSGDDHLMVNGTNSNVQFSGDGFHWTLNDIGFMRTNASTGYDTADITGNGHTLYVNLDFFTINVPGARFATIGFDDANVRPATERDVGNFTFSQVQSVDIEVRDDEIEFTSPDSGNMVTVHSFAGVNLEGGDSNVARIFTNTSSTGVTNAGDGIVQFEDLEANVFDIFYDGVGRIELTGGTELSRLALHGSPEATTLTLDTNEAQMTMTTSVILAKGYDEIVAFGHADTENTAVIVGSFDSVTPGANEFTIENEDLIVRLAQFDLVDFGSAVTQPIFNGTDADDEFLVVDNQLTINGLLPVIVTNQETGFVVDGGGGQDKLTVDARGEEAATLSSGRLETSAATTTWSNVEDAVVIGDEHGEINILGSAEDDVFRLSGSTTSLTTSDGTAIAANSFGTVSVDSNGGNDLAYMSGTSEGLNTFIGTEQWAKLTTPTQEVTARGFDLVSVVSRSSNDLASFVGSEGDEQLYVNPESARMEGDSFILNAAGFNRVIARSGGGVDYANVTDSVEDDLFYARVAYSRTEFGTGQTVTLNDFRTVRSVSSEGDDRAQLIGTQVDESFIASDRFGRFNSNGFSAIAVSYPNVLSNGGGGNDEAFLSDSAGDDFFYGSPEQSFLNGSGFQNTAIDFDRVVAFGSEGYDSAEFHGSEAADKFYANPSVADLTGDDYFQFASGFDFVRAYGEGGNDTATLRDSDEVDNFFSNSELAYLRNDNFHNEVRDFANVKAISTAGADIATFEGSVGDDYFHGHRDSSYLEGNSFRNQANGFATVNATGLVGADVANLYDSDEDENFGGRENKAWLQGETYQLQVTDFESVNAFGFRGGSNQFFVDNPDFDWERFGTWDG